jgi:UDP-glucose 4-epimerase
VTGGTGYLGARIGEALVANGYNVDLGSRKPFSNGMVEGCNQIFTNWNDQELSFCRGYDIIIHAAGMNANDCKKNPQLAFEFNGKITETFVKKAAYYGCKSFVYLSTVHIYKNPLTGSFNEKSPNLNTHPYAVSRILGEQALVQSAKTTSMRIHILRLSNCFGYPITQDNGCWGLVLNDFIRDAFRLGRITIRGDSFSRRDFLPISEFNRILIKIIGNSGVFPKILNISTGNSLTLLEAAEKVSNVLTEIKEKPVEIIKENFSENSYKLTIENHSLCKMGILPRKSLIEEIKLMIKFLK